MALQVYLIFEDGQRELADDFGDLGEAVAYALAKADDIGERPFGDGHGPPKRIEIYTGNQMELSIQITPGGLLGHKGGPKQHSM